MRTAQHSYWRTVLVVNVAIGCCCMVSGCSLLAFGAVALGENRRANSPEAVAAREADRRQKLARVESIQQKAELGDAYAAIELAKKCYETSYPCLVREPEKVFKKYSELGYDIASYYHASIQLGLNVWGAKIHECKRFLWGTCKFVDVRAGTQTMTQLARKGCEYEVQAFERLAPIFPCHRLERSSQ